MTDKIEWGGTPGPWKNDPNWPADIQTFDGHELAAAFDKGAEGSTWIISGCVANISKDEQRTNARAIAEVPAMVHANRATIAHLELMQYAMVEYLKPDGALDKNGFVQRIIHLLDGPEQRELQEGITSIIARIEKTS